VSLLSTASRVLGLLRDQDVRGCLVGGLAVSARCEPRFTRDVDIAVAVDSDARAEALVHVLVTHGLRVVSLVEQESAGRMAMVRLGTDDGLSIDLLMASSGIEFEVVTSAERLEVVRGLVLSVARVGHLIALKLLSVAPGRETDSADLRNLAAVAGDEEWSIAKEAVLLIEARGFARGRRLSAELNTLRESRA
jgi:hypothetical protein